jgi:ABC-type sugar transport system permease subunit
MRRYLLVRAAWQAGVLFGFISLAYVVAFVVPKTQFGHDPGYGGFLRDLAHGSLGRSAAPQPGNAAPSVRLLVWDAFWVTISFLLMTGVFAVALGTLFALATVRSRRWRPVVRASA